MNLDSTENPGRSARLLRFDRLHNVRDLGGYSTRDGQRVRWRLLYRADSLGNLSGEDVRRFGDLGVETVIDLRYPYEIAAAGRVPAELGVDFHNLSIEHRPYDQTAISVSVEPARFFADRYAEVAEDGAAELRRVLEVIGAHGRLPLMFHCKSGKDRTGIVAALVLTLLGVDREDVVADFDMSNLATPAFHAEHESSGLALPAWPGFGRAPARAMRLFLAELEEAYGSVPGYAAERLELAPEVIRGLKARLLAP